MPPAGYPAFLQYLQSGRVRNFHHVRDRNLRRPRDDPPTHYRFHWMGTHLKQEIGSFGGCQAIPQTWSVEG